MKKYSFRILCVLLLLSSLAGYMEWGTGQHTFIFQAERLILSKMFTDPASVLHPMILLPIGGQLLMLVAVFRGPSSAVIALTGMGLVLMLFLLILVAGIAGSHGGMIISVMPFIALSLIFSLSVIKSRKAAHRST